MHPTEVLVHEHDVILGVLACLGRIVERGRRAGRVDRRDASDALDVVSGYADGIHHGKEEDALLPALVRAGLPRDAGPVAVMLHEHARGRAAVRGMRAELDGAAGGDAAALGAFVRHAREYVGLLQEHIAKENDVLFPIARRVLGPELERDVAQRFAALDADAGGERRRLSALAAELCARLGLARVPEAVGPAASDGACGGAARVR